MASTSTSKEYTTVTCPSCDYTVPQAPGTRRTICPNCGKFYDKNAGGRPPESRRLQRQRAQKPNINNEERSGGRLQTITNFFHNLNPGRKRSPKSENQQLDTSAHQLTELPAIDNSGRLTAKSSCQSPRSPLSPAQTSLSPLPGSSPSAPGTISQLPSPDKSNSRSENGRSSRSPRTPRVVYPSRNVTVEKLKEDFHASKQADNWKPMTEYYATTFESFLEINAAFKKEPDKAYETVEDPGLKFDFIETVFNVLIECPQDTQKAVLKAVINSLLKDRRPHSKDDLRAYLVLLQNPQFGRTHNYVIFAHLLRQIAALSDPDHHFLVHWLKKLNKRQFLSILVRLHSFISIRLFPPKVEDLPPIAKCSWWIPSATKVMALLNAANNLIIPPHLSYTEFYNSTLDHLNLMSEYYTWQNPSSQGGFSFCQYPFILSISAKRNILQRDSEQQMITMARRSLVAKVQRRQVPDIGMLFLNLKVRRSHLVSDSLNEIARKQHDLKKKLKVTFAGEPGLDMGGLTKEWFLLLVRKIFQPEYGMFKYDKRAGVHWFLSGTSESLQEYNLVGVLMGLAVYNSIILDIRFPACCYRKLLSPAVVPYNNPKATVGVTNGTIEDLQNIQPEVARSLRDVLEYEGDVENDLCLTFQVTYEEMGTMKTHSLRPGGVNISVTSENRKDYVQAYIDWVVNKLVYQQFKAFYHGFHSVCASNALIMLRPEEVEVLVCGNPKLDMAELKKVTVYDGYSPNDPIIKSFWDVVINMPSHVQKRLLLFCTGSDRIPVGGMGEMTFKITKVNAMDLLPMSHTCFNQLILPPYKSRKVMKQKLILAIENAEGFGLE